LIAASESLVAEVNTSNGYMWQELFADLGDACEALGLTV
jgi:hypothetical protein